MDESLHIDLDDPRVVDGAPLLIAGLAGHYTFATNEGIPQQWQRFAPYIGNLPGQHGPETYGVCCDADAAGKFRYIAGVRVRDSARLPPELVAIQIPRQRYAVFRHPDHVSKLRRTHYTIWNEWLPASGSRVTDGPNFELYGADFDPRVGTGTIEVWIPIA